MNTIMIIYILYNNDMDASLKYELMVLVNFKQKVNPWKVELMETVTIGRNQMVYLY